jgi:putative transposase
VGVLLFGGLGRLTGAAYRRKVIELIGEANDAGAGVVSACLEVGTCLRTLKRWRKAFVRDVEGQVRRKGSDCMLPIGLARRSASESC